jgi:subtilisin family serine protease
MRLSHVVSVVAAAAVTASLAAPASAADADVQDYLVVTSGFAAAALPGRAEVQQRFPSVGAALVTMTAAEAERLDRDPNVVVSPDAPYTLGEVKPDGLPWDSAATRAVASMEYGAQRAAESWGLDRIDQRRGTNGAYRTRPGVDGRGVHVYLIDSGLAVDHAEFDGRVGDGADFVGDGNGVRDCDGHGTHVAGTIASSVFGVAPRAIVHPVRIMGCDGGGSMSDFVAALDWVRRNAPRNAVANASGGGSYNPAVNQAVDNFVDSGTPLVVAAGNDADEISYYSPASAQKATTVMAIDRGDVESAYTNYGPEGDIFAPGTNIWSTYYADPSKTMRASGTSMAAPHVTGFMALRLQVRPGESAQATKQAMYSQSTKNVVDTYVGGYTDDLLYTYGVAYPQRVAVAAVNRRSKVRVDVDPSVGAQAWKVRIQKQRPNGRYTTVRTVSTRRTAEVVTVNVPRGRYRAVVPAQYGYPTKVSRAVFVRR